MPWPPYRLEDGLVVTSMAVSPDAALIAEDCAEDIARFSYGFDDAAP